MSTPAFGDRVRTRGGVTGRFIGEGLALYVSAQDNDLFVTEVLTDGAPPNMLLPVPGDEAIRAAAAALRYPVAPGPAITGPEWVTTPADQHEREQAVIAAATAYREACRDIDWRAEIQPRFDALGQIRSTVDALQAATR